MPIIKFETTGFGRLAFDVSFDVANGPEVRWSKQILTQSLSLSWEPVASARPIANKASKASNRHLQLLCIVASQPAAALPAAAWLARGKTKAGAAVTIRAATKPVSPSARQPSNQPEVDHLRAKQLLKKNHNKNGKNERNQCFLQIMEIKSLSPDIVGSFIFRVVLTVSQMPS